MCIRDRLYIGLDKLLAWNKRITIKKKKCQGIAATIIAVSYTHLSYIDDNNNSRGTNTILDEGTSGKRTVVANVTYANGREVARDIVKENITEESKPGKIAVGTLTQTDYIKPVAGTRCV